MKNVNEYVFVATFLYACNTIFTYIIKKNYILYIFLNWNWLSNSLLCKVDKKIIVFNINTCKICILYIR